MTLREKIIDFRASHGLSQVQTAKILGVSRDTISGIESERKVVRDITQRRIEIAIDRCELSNSMKELELIK